MIECPTKNIFSKNFFEQIFFKELNNMVWIPIGIDPT